jgi:hypothetical protein
MVYVLAAFQACSTCEEMSVALPSEEILVRLLPVPTHRAVASATSQRAENNDRGFNSGAPQLLTRRSITPRSWVILFCSCVTPSCVGALGKLVMFCVTKQQDIHVHIEIVYTFLKVHPLGGFDTEMQASETRRFIVSLESVGSLVLRSAE